MSITTVATPGNFSDNLGYLSMPSDCQGYFLLGGDQASSVIDQMGGAPATLAGTIDYKQGYADFRGGGYGEFPATSPSRNRTTILVSSSAANEQVYEAPDFRYPPIYGPATMRYAGGMYTLQWNGTSQFVAVTNGTNIRTESGDIATPTNRKSNDPIAYTDGTFDPNFWVGGLITSPSLTTALVPVGRGVFPITQAFSGTAAAASKTRFGNADGPASSHACIAAIAQFPALTVEQALVRINIMLSDVSRRLGYRVKLGEVDGTA